MKEDEELNELVIDVLMKSLVEEGLPRDRVEKGIHRFQKALREQSQGPASERLRNERGHEDEKTR